jgi:hypothetical protein
MGRVNGTDRTVWFLVNILYTVYMYLAIASGAGGGNKGKCGRIGGYMCCNTAPRGESGKYVLRSIVKMGTYPYYTYALGYIYCAVKM